MKKIIVIGGGHAGCEAALATARLGARVTLFALSLDSIALMPCNPCVGGSAKGHLVREIDALGGQMGKAIDATFIQSRMLNTAKGPAVYSLRAQADKKRYMEYMKQVLESEPNISLREGEITEILTEDEGGTRVVGVRTESGGAIPCDAVIVCTGTYLNARCLYGETITHTGPNGMKNARGLSENLQKLGFPLQRFKTGTPARIHRRSIDFSKMAVQPGDEKIVPFSFENSAGEIAREQIACHLTYTTHETHELIRASIHRSAMYSGLITATGTRYCPSIEDKIMRFADKERHPVFIEPEGLGTQEMYVQGMSSALPEDVQIEVYRSVPGLENCEIMRVAYAIEYDCIDATQLTLGLEAKHIAGLFFAGQICGSSGYEEAAAQGLIAGLAAAGAEIEIGRADGYIGVLIDDLVTKGTREPYRMMTSRAEYRLLLRQDNADLRLTPKGYAAGLIPEKRYAAFLKKSDAIEKGIAALRKISVSPEDADSILTEKNSTPIKSGVKLSDLIKRPELSYIDFKNFIPQNYDEAVCEQINIQIKYEGYISIQLAQAEAFRKIEGKLLPPEIDYEKISGLRIEARQKLSALRPVNFGQASRITGVSPADLSVLMVYVKTLTH
ncbi:MAG: tRNA uridine-5-carboxymethylaminomethyl(34) synthesis enzyme MnmG [Clostridiales bacterium]|jgi:tRNA uridine 5-carboxymethylaminomethyl modification enzyme|nr:tRNA uridine-5-carboxymethylaminomethyl(34) synthesis enzyme MnmG [Clostridiales bacterium]